ncbi:curli-like amyloid fiber formation chaperone CsgH [Rhizobium sp. BR 362]|uniref:curli-like amyloid fiber formation chaperone CsgH n=1 Tax=Rhizobium sp. BR 362 TaxID=3040670 RepID=UPI002F3E2E06
MPHVVNHPRRLIAAFALVLLPAGALAAMVATDQSGGGLRCEIRATPEAGMVTLEALARADKRVSGNYTFHVKSAGSAGGSNIDQSGAFDATPGRAVTLGSVSLRSKAGAYDATLDITAGDNTVRCARRIDEAN